jgi:hypothetical protein
MPWLGVHMQHKRAVILNEAPPPDNADLHGKDGPRFEGKTSVFGLAVNETAVVYQGNEQLTNRSTADILAGINGPAVADLCVAAWHARLASALSPMKIRHLVLLCSVGAAIAAPTAMAATVIVNSYSSGDASRMWITDTMGGTATPAPSAFGIDLITDLAQACDGAVYATDFMRLYRVDSSGMAARVHPANVHGFTCVGLDFAADGTLFGITQSGQVLKFDTNDGTAQVVCASSFQYIGDIAFFGMSGTNYIFYATATSGHIIRLTVDVVSSAGDSETPAASVIAPGEQFPAVDFAGGILTGIASSGNLYSIDVTTGIGALTGHITGPANYGGMTSATQPTVALSVAQMGSQVEVAWRPPFTNYVLEATGVLPAAVWSEVSTLPLISDGRAAVILDAPDAAHFFRLRCR